MVSGTGSSAYSISQAEHFKTLATRTLQSPAFRFFYFTNGILSIICLIISFMYSCPGTYYYVLEVLINVALILEVGTRYIALQKVNSCQRWMFFKDWIMLTFLLWIEILGFHLECGWCRHGSDLFLYPSLSTFWTALLPQPACGTDDWASRTHSSEWDRFCSICHAATKEYEPVRDNTSPGHWFGLFPRRAPWVWRVSQGTLMMPYLILDSIELK